MWFLLDLVGDAENALVEVEAQGGRRVYIERALLRPAATGPDISRYRLFGGGPNVSQRLLFPYDENGAISESRMAAEFPQAYRYLSEFQSELESRISVAGSGQPWYGLVRPREDAWLAATKILSRDLIASPAFALDYAAGVHLIGGTAIIPADADIALPLLGFLNSRAFGLILRQGASEYRGQYIKAEPGRLASVFVPRSVLIDPELAALVDERLGYPSGNDDLDKRIDDLVDRHVSDIKV